MNDPAVSNRWQRWRGSLLGLSLFALLLGAIALQLWWDDSQAVSVGSKAPHFRLETFHHGSIDTETLRGKVILVNFWGSWCTACHLEAEDLQRLWQRYRDEDVSFIGVAYLDTLHDASAYLKKYGIDYPTGLDTIQQITRQFQINGAPETFLIDRSGIIRYFQAGPIDTRALTRAIERAIAQPA
ncbi:MAG: TlpA disulfide reductase family protein [Anaerolineaceae bacterium]|nr:TlpA disulfide reductase family protein [Anaerolineaceae bacterium]MCY3935362.1 TlpA disulfide reductase family protein [Chloroflexota bacterium]MCY4009689.1 TlpA disulfide reductase family protein [Anaerolineaceae bacterium]